MGVKRILIVDDDAMVRRVLMDMLRPEGYELMEAVNGKAATQMATGTEIDLVITDLVMPEQEGIETIRLLRERLPILKILAMSGAFGGEFLTMVGHLGADGTLSKPLRYQEVLKAVRSALGIASAGTPKH